MPTVQQEILREIRKLDAEETGLHRKAERLRTEAARADAEAEALAVKRRQYEFCFTELGGEFPKPAAVEVPVRHGGRFIGQLG